MRRKREFEEEKQKVWALFQQDKQNEYNKIKVSRFIEFSTSRELRSCGLGSKVQAFMLLIGCLGFGV